MRKNFASLLSPVKLNNARAATVASIVKNVAEDALTVQNKAKELQKTVVQGKGVFAQTVKETLELQKETIDAVEEEEAEVEERLRDNRRDRNDRGGNAGGNAGGNQQQPQNPQQQPPANNPPQNPQQQPNAQGELPGDNQQLLNTILGKLSAIDNIRDDIKGIRHDLTTQSERISSLRDDFESDMKRRRDAAVKGAKTKRLRKYNESSRVSTNLAKTPLFGDSDNELDKLLDSEAIPMKNLSRTLTITGNTPPASASEDEELPITID